MKRLFFLQLIVIIAFSSTASAQFYYSDFDSEDRDLKYAAGRANRIYPISLDVTDSSESVRQLAYEISACGFGHTGPKCLDSRFKPLMAKPGYKKKWGYYLFLSAFKDKGAKKSYLYVSEVLKESDTALEEGSQWDPTMVRSAVVYSIPNNLTYRQMYRAYKSGNLKAVIRIKMPRQLSDLIPLLAKTRDHRKLYHFANHITMSDDDRFFDNRVYPYLWDNLDIISKMDGNREYQYAMWRLVEGSDRELLLALSRIHVRSDYTVLRQYSACALANSGTVTPQIRKIILDAFKSDNYWIRGRAVNTFARHLMNGLSDELIYLEMMGDSHSEVYGSIFWDSKDTMKFTVAHLPALEHALKRSTNPEGRRYTISLMTKLRFRETIEVWKRHLKREKDPSVIKRLKEAIAKMEKDLGQAG